MRTILIATQDPFNMRMNEQRIVARCSEVQVSPSINDHTEWVGWSGEKDERKWLFMMRDRGGGRFPVRGRPTEKR